jgi:hypothetical protein
MKTHQLRVRIQYKRYEATEGEMRPTIEVGVLLPIAAAPVAAGVPFGPCMLLLAEQENPGRRPDTDNGSWDGNAWWSTRGEHLDPVGYAELPNKEEMKAFNAKFGVDERDGVWRVYLNVEAVH